MNSWLKTLTACALMLAGAASPAASPETIAIVGADVLPMTGPDRLRDQTVIIRGDRIEAIGPRSKIKVPASARRIAATGLTLMPGLVDMHVHAPNAPGEKGDAAARALAVMLAYGTTTARSMAGVPSHPDLRAKVERGELPGPRLYVGTTPFHSGNTPDEKAAREKVAAAKAAGFDLIKSHHIEDPKVWEAVQQESAKQGLATGGHVAGDVGLLRAMAAGQQIEHLDGALKELLPPNSPARAEMKGQFPPPPLIDVLARVPDAEFARLAAKVKAANSYQVPTLGLFERVFDLETPTARFAAEPAMRFIAAPALEQWAKQREGMKSSGLTAAQGRVLRDMRRKIARVYHAAGVPLMAGSDTAQAYHVWGEALIKEIEALAAAGIPPMDALRSATVVPRNYFRSLPSQGSASGWKADFGTVEPGARADLILLGGDPSRNLRALRDLRGVMAAGVWRDKRALDALLAEAALAANPPGKK